jgi:hypothetical protein
MCSLESIVAIKITRFHSKVIGSQEYFNHHEDKGDDMKNRSLFLITGRNSP